MSIKALPITGDTNWGTSLNNYLTQLTDNTNGGGINTFTAFSQRPTNLVADDKGKTYLYTQTGNLHQWDGSSWKVLNESVINVKDYGAVGDGVVDDTAALQLCLTQFKTIFIPTGTFKITQPLQLTGEININGNGKLNTIIKAINCAGFVRSLSSNYPGNWNIGNFTLMGDGADDMLVFDETKSGFYFPKTNLPDEIGIVANCNIHDMSIYNFKGHGMFFGSHFSDSFKDIYSSKNGGHAFVFAGGPAVNLINLYAGFVASGKTGYRIYGGLSMISCNGIDSGDSWGIFGASTAEDGFEGYANVTMIQCNIEAMKQYGILIKIGNVNFESCYFVNQGNNIIEAFVKGTFNFDGPTVFSNCRFFGTIPESHVLALGNQGFTCLNMGQGSIKIKYPNAYGAEIFEIPNITTQQLAYGVFGLKSQNIQTNKMFIAQIQEFPDNTSAKNSGIGIGCVYRTGEVLKIVF
jgi:Pectate lyase superfamily protein